MRLRRRVRTTIAIGAVMAMVASSAAIADELVNDGDTLSSGVQTTLAFGNVCVNEVATRSVDHWLTRGGGAGNTYQNGSHVTVSAGATHARLSVTDPPTSIQIPADWTSAANGTVTPSVASTVSFTAGATLGSFSSTIPFAASGTNLNNNSNVRTASLAVTANVVNCTVSTTTTAGNATATYGDSAVTLTATVSPSSANAGTVTFTVKDGATTVGTVTSGTVTSGSATASFPLTSVGAGDYTVDAAYSGASGFTASDTGSQSPKATLTVQKAATVTAVTCTAGPFTYDGDAKTPCSATVSGHELNAPVPVSYAGNVNAGTATATATYAGSPNHLGSSDSATFAIGKAATSTVVTCPAGPFAYTGSPQTPCSATVSGPQLTDSVPVVHTNNTDAGTATATATYVESVNHQGSSGSTEFVIGEAGTTTTVTCTGGPFTYDGEAKTPCTATVTGPGLNESVPVEYSDNVNAGTVTATATYPGSGNHVGSTNSTTFTIGKAASTTTVTCLDGVTYTGGLLTPCTASVTGDGGLEASPTVTYVNNRDAGSASASASFAGTDNHLGSDGSATFSIAKAPTTTAITCPAEALTFTGSAQTPCSASTSGVGGLSASPAVVYGNNTNAGTANANATYTESANHLGSVADQITFTIDKAPTTTTVECPVSVTYTGSALTPCSATTIGAGDLVASPTVVYGNNTNAGTATASADYEESDNHLASSDTDDFKIDKAPTTTTVTCDDGPFTYTGDAHEPCSARVTGPGGLDEDPEVVYSDNVNAGTATAAASYAGGDNHEPSEDATEFEIDKASTTTAVTCAAGPFTFTGLAHTPCSATVTGAGDLDEELEVEYEDNTGAGTATATASYDESANHLGSSDSKEFSIGKAASSTVVTCPAATQTFTGDDIEPCSASVTGAGGLEQPLTVGYTNNRDAGTATATASFGGGDNHFGSSDSKNFEIERATTITVVTCGAGPFVYDTDPHEPCSARVTGPGGLDQTVDVVYSGNVNAGTASATATYAGDGNREGSTNTATFEIDKATSTVEVTCAAGPFTYTGSAHEPCTARATGSGLNEVLSVTYTGNVGAGTATASATFAGGTNHTGSTGSDTFEIAKAPSMTTLTCPASVTYTGTALTPCSAQVTGAGDLDSPVTVTYTGNTDAGAASASASYAGSLNHEASSDSGGFMIAKAPTTTTVTCTGAPFTYTGLAHTPCSATTTGNGLNASPMVSYEDNIGAGNATASASYAESANHLGSSDSKQFTIGKAPTTVSVSCPGGPFTYTGSEIVPCSAHATGVGALNEVLTVTYSNNVAVGTATASASYAGGVNHLPQTGSSTFQVVHAAGGILQPINPDGSSVFKINSTIPVKVKLTDASAGYGGGNFTLSLTRLGSAVEGNVEEIVSSTSAHSGNTLRYDAKDDQYIFNLGTKGLKVGTYRVTVTLDDGTTRTATFGLR